MEVQLLASGHVAPWVHEWPLRHLLVRNQGESLPTAVAERRQGWCTLRMKTLQRPILCLPGTAKSYNLQQIPRRVHDPPLLPSRVLRCGWTHRCTNLHKRRWVAQEVRSEKVSNARSLLELHHSSILLGHSFRYCRFEILRHHSFRFGFRSLLSQPAASV